MKIPASHSYSRKQSLTTSAIQRVSRPCRSQSIVEKDLFFTTSRSTSEKSSTDLSLAGSKANGRKPINLNINVSPVFSEGFNFMQANHQVTTTSSRGRTIKARRDNEDQIYYTKKIKVNSSLSQPCML